MEVDYSDPRCVLVAFFTAMNAWEKECWKRRKEPDIRAEQARALAAMTEIFSQFCTQKDRKYGRNGSFRSPPEYDPENERIVSIHQTKARAQIVTQESAGLSQTFQYVLIKKAERWLVDNKQWLDSTAKWQRTAL